MAGKCYSARSVATKLIFSLLFFVFILQKENYHTHLAVLYLDTVLQLRKDASAPKSEMDLARSTLRHMLQESSVYRVPLILSKVKETDMHAECAILYGKVIIHRVPLIPSAGWSQAILSLCCIYIS